MNMGRTPIRFSSKPLGFGHKLLKSTRATASQTARSNQTLESTYTAFTPTIPYLNIPRPTGHLKKTNINP